MLDLEVIRNILKQLEAVGQKKISLSDLAIYSHCNYQQIKKDLAIISKCFNVQQKGRSIYISLKD